MNRVPIDFIGKSMIILYYMIRFNLENRKLLNI